MRWNVYRVTATHMGGVGRSLAKLGGINARHYGHALLKASAKWPQHEGEIVVRMANKRQLARNTREGEKALREIRAAYSGA